MPNWSLEEVKSTKAGAAFFDPVRAVETPQRERRAKAALVPKPQGQRGGKGSVVIVVTLIACRHRLIDDDNSIAGCKPLRDAIAKSLGIDDADERVQWCYDRHRTDGAEGVIVRIESL